MEKIANQILTTTNQYVAEDETLSPKEPLIAGAFMKAYSLVADDVEASQKFLRWANQNEAAAKNVRMIMAELGNIHDLPLSGIVNKLIKHIDSQCQTLS